ncbi:MAG: hypothetical protein CVU57_16095 [Deltaproteobacteria bacterium HGW-Deltaproteobacteria-15]|jgi:hypothetical protein|nr:MAG: hypothetical protein CVU57_16095 [Deltaproteobacteria bacterium HGW-Deltaproteobacteria-15]
MSELDKNELLALFKATDFNNENSYRLFCEQLLDISGATFWQNESKKLIGERDSAKGRVRELAKLTEKKLEQIKKNKNRSATDSKLLEYQIVSEAKKNKSYSPTQIYKLLREDFQQAEDNSFYVPILDENKNEISRKSVGQYVSEFLSNPENDNLVEADNSKGGSGHFTTSYPGSKRQGKDRRGKPKSRRKYPPEIVKAADERGLSPQDWAEILEHKKEVTAKRKGSN